MRKKLILIVTILGFVLFFISNSIINKKIQQINTKHNNFYMQDTVSENEWYKRYAKTDKEIQELIELKENILNPSQDEIVTPDKKAFDVIIFMGQSNMVGYGAGANTTVKTKEEAIELYNSTKYEKIQPITDAAYEMQYNSKEQAYGVSRLSEPFGYSTFSPSTGSMVTAFTNAYYLNTGTPVICIPAAKGDSSIDDWQEKDEYLERAKSRYKEACKFLNEKGYKIRHSYMIWDQGEADVENVNNYENALHNTIIEMQDIGIERCFLIRIGNLYLPAGKEMQYKERYELYKSMIQKQTDICEKNNWVTIVSESMETLSHCWDMMSDQVHFNQEALNIVGAEAGKNVAKYANQCREATLTQEQANWLVNFAKNFSETGFQKRKLVYGINRKFDAYNLNLINYKTMYSNGIRLIYFLMYDKDTNNWYLNYNNKTGYNWEGSTNPDDFAAGEYIGFDCSGWVSFLYHYVFGLPFHTIKENYGGTGISITQPWSTEELIENPKIKSLDSQEEVNTFKVVYEQHSKKATHYLNEVESKINLQSGDLIIGRKGENDDGTIDENKNHVVMYIGNGKITHATSIPNVYNMKLNNNYYYIGESRLEYTDEYESQKYCDIYVLRLNNNIIPKSDFVYNNQNVNWDKLQCTGKIGDTKADLIAPNVDNIEYINNPTNGNVLAKITLNEEIQNVDEWERSTNKKVLTKEYSLDTEEEIVIRDLAGNGTIVKLTIKLDRNLPTAGTLIMKEDNENGIDYSEKTWTSHDVYIKPVDGSDEESGHAETTYSVEGAETIDNQTQSMILKQTGEYTITIKTKDKAGNTATREYKIKIDKENPKLEVTENPTDWTNKEKVTLNITALDGHSGLKNVTLDGREITLKDGRATYDVSTNGTYRFIATDNVNNTKTVEVNVDKIDRNAPTIKVNPEGTTWTKETSIKITTTDNIEESGLNNPTYEYYLSTSENALEGGNIENYTSGIPFNISGKTGIYYLFVKQVTDKAGNKSTTNGTTVTIGGEVYHKFGPYKFDNTEPTAGTLMMKEDSESGIDYSEKTWTSHDVYIKPIDGSDEESGHSETTYSVEGPIELNNQKNSTVLNKTGTYTVTVTTKDNLDFTSTNSYTIKIDKEDPKLEVTKTSTDWTNKEKVTLNITASDGHSGLKNVTLDGREITLKDGRATYDVSTNGTYRFIATDNVNNTKTVEVNVDKIDRKAPTITVNPEGTTWTKETSITITTTDNIEESGLNNPTYEYYLSTSENALEGGNIENYTSGIPFNISGKTGIYYLFVKQVTDKAGNKSTTNGTTVTIGEVVYHKFGPYKFDNTEPTAGTLIMKEDSDSGIDYSEKTWTSHDVYIKPVDGSDEESGHAETTYSVEGPIELNNEKNSTILNKTGTYTVTVTTKDNLNFTSTNSYTIKIDKEAPKLEVTENPTDWTNKEKVTLNITASDGHSGLKNVTVNGTEVILNKGRATYDVSTNGTYTFVATDNVNNTKTVKIKVDKIYKEIPSITVNPDKTINTNANNYLKEVNIIITLDTGEIGLNNPTYEYYLSTSENTLEGGNIENYTSGIPFNISGKTGTYYLFVKQVTDKAGNKSTTNGTTVTIGEVAYHRFGPYKFDNTEPTAGTLIMKEDSESGIDYLEKTWTSHDIYIKPIDGSDEESGHAETTYSVEGPIELNNEKNSTILNKTGTYTVTVTTKDNLNFTSTNSYTIKIDKEAPKLEVTENPTDWTNKEKVTLNITASDEHSGIQKVTVDGREITLKDGTATYDVLTNGTYTFVATDNVNNTKTIEINVDKIDRNAPTITVNPEGTTWTKETSITITTTDNSEESGLKYYLSTSENALEGGDIENYTSGIPFNISGKTGTYYLFVKQVTDKAGNKSTTNGTTVTIGEVVYHRFGPYKFDNTEPTAGTLIMKEDSDSGIDYSEKTWTSHDIYIKPIDGSDEESEHAETTYSVEGAETIDNQTQSMILKQTGEYTITIKTKDKAGNTATREYKIKIDKENPKLEVTENPTDWTNKEKVTLNITASDGHSGLKNVTVNGTEVTLNNEKGTYEVTQNGRYTFIATDKVGNITTEVFNIDKLETIQIGDINADSYINITDLFLLKRHLISETKQSWKLKGDSLIRADINKDEIINISDIFLLKRLVLKNIK